MKQSKYIIIVHVLMHTINDYIIQQSHDHHMTHPDSIVSIVPMDTSCHHLAISTEHTATDLQGIYIATITGHTRGGLGGTTGE